MIKLNSKNSILILAALVVLLLGATNFWLSKRNPLETKEPDVVKLETQSSSDETSDIEKDLEETDLSHLDAELNDIEAELSASD